MILLTGQIEVAKRCENLSLQGRMVLVVGWMLDLEISSASVESSESWDVLGDVVGPDRVV